MKTTKSLITSPCHYHSPDDKTSCTNMMGVAGLPESWSLGKKRLKMPAVGLYKAN
jgi:hypothetical protein